MLNKAPSKKPILSHYPPGHTVDLDKKTNSPAVVCGPHLCLFGLESQIVRLEETVSLKKKQNEYPAFAPFTAAGYFIGAFSFLQEKCRSFLPWIFMGEEIIASSLVDGGGTISLDQSSFGHIYVRQHKLNLQSVHRAFTNGVQSLKAMVLDRVKYQLGYPEAARTCSKHRVS
jgi:hypothetical protein